VPKYGLAVTGIVPVDKIVRNSTAQPGDVLVLTKPIGNGILVSAYRALSGKRFRRSPPSLDDAVKWMTMLNRDAARVMTEHGARAATDITGYGLIGHLLEMCGAVGAELHASAVPILDGARDYLARGYRPAGTMRNVETFRRRVDNRAGETELTLMCDAQTSGGLLMAIPEEKLAAAEAGFREGGLFYAKVGSITERAGTIALLP
jgi:selenide,water dikinase